MKGLKKLYYTAHYDAASYRFPTTHQAYRLLVWNSRSRIWVSPRRLTLGAINDALVAIIPLALILFLQIPRRKVAAKVE